MNIHTYESFINEGDEVSVDSVLSSADKKRLKNAFESVVTGVDKLTLFEVTTNNKFPMEETMIPMIKRKVVGYILQSVPIKELVHFDISKLIF